MLEIVQKSSGNAFKVDEFWLRDHCQCAECYNVETKQRRYNLLDISVHVKPVTLRYLEEDDQVVVKWSDGHHSVYNLDFLYKAQVDQVIRRRGTKSIQRTPWNREIILQNERQIHFTLSQLISNEQSVADLVGSLVRYGLIFIDGVPPTTAMTELAIRRIFPTMKTFFGEMYTFSDRQDHADTAYTKEYLGPHTDNTYWCDAAGLQALHCIEHVNGVGGNNFFVDGLHAAHELKCRDPQAFQLLSTVPVPGEYIEAGEHHTHAAPIIRVDPVTGDIVQLRYNLYDRAVFNTIPQQEMQAFYASLRAFIEIVQDASNQWSLKLQPGTVALFDNWRTFHGRESYTGQRTMTGCYVQRTDYLSKARVLGIIE